MKLKLDCSTLCIALCPLIFAGCSTPYDLKKSKPIISYVSSRPAMEVKKCIFQSWSKHQTTVFEEKTHVGCLIRFNDTLPAATVAIVTIQGEAPSVQVNYYHRTNRLKLHRMEEEVEACK